MDLKEDEVDLPLFKLNNDKASSLNGMNIRALKLFWHTLKNKFRECLSKFNYSFELPTGSNSTFLRLIPKITNPRVVQDYRPISLIKSLAKINSKVLALRLSPFMNKLVDDTQT